MNVTPTLRASLFRLLLMITLLCGVNTNLLAQPGNDSCKNALDVIPTASLNWQNSTVFQARFEASILPQGCITSRPNGVGDVWYRFTLPSPLGVLSIRGAVTSTTFGIRYQLYAGDCQTAQEVICGLTSWNNSNEIRTFPFSGYPAGTTYYLRFIGSATQINSSQFRFAIQDLGNPTRMISTATGGDWFQPSTWVQNRIPNSQDSVLIVDGATVTVPSGANTIEVKHLAVGQGDSTKVAILRFGYSNLRNTLARIKGNLTLERKDSIVFGRPVNQGPSANWPIFRFYGDMKIDGFFKAHGLLEIAADSLEPNRTNRVYGRGTLTGLLGLTCNNVSGLTFDFPIELTTNIYLHRGKITTPKSIVLRPLPLSGLFAESSAFIFLYMGALSHPIQTTDTLVSLYNDRLGNYAGDTTRRFSNIIVPLTKYTNIDLARDSKPFLIDRTVRAKRISLAGGRYLVPNNDSLITDFGFEIDGQYPTAADERNVIGGTVCSNKLQTSNGASRTLRLCKGDRAINVQFVYPTVQSGPNLNKRICMNFLDQKPTGQLPGRGRHIDWKVVRIEVEQNQLPANSYMVFALLKSDSITSLLSSVRLAQAPTPNGPWIDVSDPSTPSFVHARIPTSYQTGIALRTRTNIDFANGQYFIFYDQDTDYDLVLSNVYKPSAALAGHCGPNRLPLGLHISTIGKLSPSRAVVKMAVSGPSGNFTYLDTLSLRQFTGPNQIDTLYTNVARSPIFSTAGVYRISVTLMADGFNQVLTKQDSAEVFELDNRPLAVPYLNEYKIITRLRIPAQHWSNSNMLPRVLAEVGAWSSPASLYLRHNNSPGRISESMITTDPIAVQAGRTLQITFNWFPARFFGTITSPLDSCYIEYTTNCGNSYTTIAKYAGSYPAGYGPGVISLPFKGRAVFPIASNAVVSLRLRNISTGQPSSSYSGVLMDSLRYEYVIPSSVAGSSFTHPLTLYPNPATFEVAIIGLAEEQTPYALINNLGQVVRRGKASASDNKIPLQGLPRGLYTVATERERLRLVVE